MPGSVADLWRDFDEEGQLCHSWPGAARRIIVVMVASAVMVIVFLLLVYGVERNHLRHARRAMGRHDMVGSTDVEDRDWARIVADLCPSDRTPWIR